uniref:Uncharacterized protein n=1 Tax=Oryza rufipogon TaxID=4529 RepID=A0A0E0RCZ8_ORYRU
MVTPAASIGGEDGSAPRPPYSAMASFKLATNELEAFEPATNGLEAVADILRLPWEHCGLFAIRTSGI